MMISLSIPILCQSLLPLYAIYSYYLLITEFTLKRYVIKYSLFNNVFFFLQRRKDLEQKRLIEERRIQEILGDSPPPPWSPPNKTIPFRKEHLKYSVWLSLEYLIMLCYVSSYVFCFVYWCDILMRRCSLAADTTSVNQFINQLLFKKHLRTTSWHSKWFTPNAK